MAESDVDDLQGTISSVIDHSGTKSIRALREKLKQRLFEIKMNLAQAPQPEEVPDEMGLEHYAFPDEEYHSTKEYRPLERDTFAERLRELPADIEAFLSSLTN